MPLTFNQVINSAMGKQFRDTKLKPKTQTIVKHQEPAVKREPVQTQQQPVKLEASEVEKVQKKKKPKHNRIILRNLVVDIGEKHLRKLCGQYGQITDVSIPKHGVKNCGRGFAFVQFTKKNMCLKAIKELNQKQYKGRTIIVDLAVNKDTYKKAVEQNSKGMEVQQQQAQQVNKDAQDEKQLKVQDAQPAAKREPRQQTQEDLSSTIFIRNLSMSVNQQELSRFFRKYGKIKFAKLVIDKQTQQPKGTAFVKFRESEPAQRLIKHSREYQQSVNSYSTHKPQLDPSINLQLDGRILKIFPAQSKTSLSSKIEDRDKMIEQKNKKKPKPIKKIKTLDELIETDKHNKRNLQLALEGVCTSEPWMLREDQQKFEQLRKQKVEKLKNPNHFVSNTRIIFKYLDRMISEEDIKTLCYRYLDDKIKRKQLIYCKLMLDQQRTKSIGIAFVEFSKPETALGFLRWVKQNYRQLFPQRKAVLIEFTIQDARKISVLKKKVKKQK